MQLAGAEAEHNWVEAAEKALADNVSTFAVLPMHLVTNEWVYMGKLKEKGYLVEAPGSRPTTENAYCQALTRHNGKRRPRAGVRDGKNWKGRSSERYKHPSSGRCRHAIRGRPPRCGDAAW